MTTFGFGENDNHIHTRLDKLKLEKGEHRLGFAFWPGIDSENFNSSMMVNKVPQFVAVPRHWVKGVGSFVNEGPEWTKLAGKAPETRIATVMIHWHLTYEKKIERPPSVVPWVIDGGKYETLKKKHSRYPVFEHDIIADVTDVGFQKMTFDAEKPCLFREFLQMAESDGEKAAGARKLVDRIIQQTVAILPDLESYIARRISLEEIREKMGITSAPPVNVVSSDTDVDGLLGSLLGE